MNLKKSQPSRSSRTTPSKEIAKLRRELAAVTRERDAYRRELYRTMHAETTAMNLDETEIRSWIGRGVSSDDLIAKLKSKLKKRA